MVGTIKSKPGGKPEMGEVSLWNLLLLLLWSWHWCRNVIMLYGMYAYPFQYLHHWTPTFDIVLFLPLFQWNCIKCWSLCAVLEDGILTLKIKEIPFLYTGLFCHVCEFKNNSDERKSAKIIPPPYWMLWINICLKYFVVYFYVYIVIPWEILLLFAHRQCWVYAFCHYLFMVLWQCHRNLTKFIKLSNTLGTCLD